MPETIKNVISQVFNGTLRVDICCDDSAKPTHIEVVYLKGVMPDAHTLEQAQDWVRDEQYRYNWVGPEFAPIYKKFLDDLWPEPQTSEVLDEPDFLAKLPNFLQPFVRAIYPVVLKAWNQIVAAILVVLFTSLASMMMSRQERQTEAIQEQTQKIAEQNAIAAQALKVAQDEHALNKASAEYWQVIPVTMRAP
jgi:hypothetical protein